MTSGGVRFETTKKAVLLKGETYVDVPASAVEAGVSGNAHRGGDPSDVRVSGGHHAVHKS